VRERVLPGASADWSDERLVRACLRGDEQAWVVLLDRYKRLIYSFPRRYGASPEDAADVFQLVCVELFAALPRLRNKGSVRSWLMTVAAHQAYHWQRRYRSRVQREGGDLETAAEPSASPPAEVLEQQEREQLIREAIDRLPPRCRKLIEVMFYEQPPRPYADIARSLGLAVGSVGVIRRRCLKQLESVFARLGLSS
jgi:RNA polymerase sigma factor (sigma-70 family)